VNSGQVQVYPMTEIELRYKAMKDEIDDRGGEASLGKIISRYSYEQYIQTYIWKTISEYCRYTNPKCTRCDSTFKLQVHHVSYQNLGLELYHPEDLVVVCSKCHAIITLLQNINREMCVQWERKYYRK
jgi:hypothetical protein